MKKIVLLLCLFAFCLACHTQAQSPARTVQEISQRDFYQNIAQRDSADNWQYKNKQVTVVDFNATWCGPCRRLAPILKELAAEMPNVDFFSIDIDDNKELARQLKISSIPMLLICPVGEAPQAIVGLYPTEEIIKVIDYVSKGN